MKGWGCLALGAGAMCFANGLTALPLGAWLASLALIAFLDCNQASRSMLWVIAAVFIGFQVQFLGLLPGQAILSGAFAAIYGTLYALPFLFHPRQSEL